MRSLVTKLKGVLTTMFLLVLANLKNVVRLSRLFTPPLHEQRKHFTVINMYLNKALISPEPTLIDHSTIGRKIYIPKSFDDDLPNRICEVYEEAEQTYLVRTQRNTEYIVSKTEILIAWFPQEHYDWVMSVFREYGYLLGWIILEKRFPAYRAFLRQVIKENCDSVYYIIRYK